MTRRTQDIDAVVGLRMAARRSALGLSQTALAAQLGVSFQQVQKYEKGANRVSASRLHQVATALGCSVADFFPSRTDQDDAVVGLHALTATADGRALAEAFPRIVDPALRRAVSQVVAALASA
ncbi:helix-turn-helix domain-containing protein [Brevundimonas sp. P7753]|jgi:transcriptional regulator with XRE-family HTH domain|uniref:helix-turn-helix domain-containing protein n=1 Tax=Brevundimonas TaxID=41275 RepID=UPI0015BDFEF3|nr:helix-turn-helix transcriptional regulator [Brevundimonas sp. P7753]MBD3833282.1 helix-turn-helix transcriptional regulator [Brevundimonas sp.]NWE52342.1 helix-turn-helix transcriptional regulator [Brevundimonas sp. P7753]